MTSTPPPKLLTTGEVGLLLGYSPDTVRSLCQRGTFGDAYRTSDGGHWRISAADVANFLATARGRR